MSANIRSHAFLSISHGLIQSLQDLKQAALLSLLIEHRRYLLSAGKPMPGGWFYVGHRLISSKLFVSENSIRSWMAPLVELNLVKTKLTGMPQRAYYLLDDDAIDALIVGGEASSRGDKKDVLESGEFGEPLIQDPQSQMRNNCVTDAQELSARCAEIEAYSKKEQKEQMNNSTFGTKGDFSNPHTKPRFLPKRIEPTKPLRLNNNPHQIQLDKQKQSLRTEIPTALESIVARWRSMAVEHRQGTKALRDGVDSVRRALNGTLFNGKRTWESKHRKYSEHEIMQAFDNFDLKRNSPDHLPKDKHTLRSISLASFFYCAHMVNGHDGNGASLFLECLEGRPKLAADLHPELTLYVQEKHFHFKSAKLPKGTAARVANRLSKVWAEQAAWLRAHGVPSVKPLCAQWMALLADRYGQGWSVGNLLGQGSFESFQQYLMDN